MAVARSLFEVTVGSAANTATRDSSAHPRKEKEKVRDTKKGNGKGKGCKWGKNGVSSVAEGRYAMMYQNGTGSA